ncbi:zinc transporter ZIP3 [Puntigrus tetrazona]|uniref:zinc transporter ZIP3 n=1 Tax=Puntigrus tetrazona TaxID=1606681 RepID=UPI001C88E514|nr:zinc transporter ZIP3 [Puntigrus tetrazona]
MDSSGVSPGLLHIKLLTLVLMLCFSLLCGFSPVCVLRRVTRFSSDPGPRLRVLSLGSCLAGGVFLACCLLELLPDFLKHTRDTVSRLDITLHFPLSEFLLAVGFLLVLVLEQMLLVFRDQPSESSQEKQALMDAEERSRAAEGGPGHRGLRVFLLLLCVCVRAFLDGLSVGSLEECVTLLLHEGLLAFSLSVLLTHLSLRRTLLSGALLLFSLSGPAGIGAALALDGLESGAQGWLVRCTVEGLTAGIFLNISLLGSLRQDSGSPRHRIHKVAFLLTGFALVTAVLFCRV